MKSFDLKKVALFSILNESELREVEPYLVPVTYKKKDVIFSEGEPPEWLYVVVEGKIKLTKLSQDGKEIILEIMSPLDFFGGLAVLRGFPYPANAVVMENSKFLRISRNNIMKIIDRFPNLMYCLAMLLGDRMKESHETLKNIALERVETRIAALLLKLADKTGKESGGGIVIEMKLTKQDIAEMVGTTVETSIRTMSKLKKMGIVTEKEGRITITNIDRLKSLC